MAKFASHYGFTLLEMTIALTIGIVVAGIGIPLYSKFRETQDIKAIGGQMVSQLNLVATNAVAAKKPYTNCDVFEGYKVEFNNSMNPKMIYQPVCNNSGTSTPVDPVVTYLLPNKYSYQTPATSADLIFKALGQGVTSSIEIQIKNDTNTKYYSFCIRTTGTIRDCGYSTTLPSCLCD